MKWSLFLKHQSNSSTRHSMSSARCPIFRQESLLPVGVPSSVKRPCDGRWDAWWKTLWLHLAELSQVPHSHALKGQKLLAQGSRALPWARSFCPFRACGANLRKLNHQNGGFGEHIKWWNKVFLMQNEIEPKWTNFVSNIIVTFALDNVSSPFLRWKAKEMIVNNKKFNNLKQSVWNDFYFYQSCSV